MLVYKKSSNRFKVGLDLGNVNIRVINNSSETLELLLEDLQVTQKVQVTSGNSLNDKTWRNKSSPVVFSVPDNFGGL